MPGSSRMSAIDLRQRVQLEELDPGAVVQRVRAARQLDRRVHAPRRARVAIRVRPPQRVAVQVERHVVHRPRVHRDRSDRDARVERLGERELDLRPHRLDVPVQVPVALDERRLEAMQLLEAHDVALERAEHDPSARRAEIDRQVARSGAHRPLRASTLTGASARPWTPPRDARSPSARDSPTRGTRAPDRARHRAAGAPPPRAAARPSRTRA